MVKYKHVLLATDLAKGSTQIAKRAAEIASKYKAKLSVVHVLEHTPVVYGGGEFSIPLDINLEEALQNQAAKALAKLGKQVKIAGANQYVLTGSTKSVVIELAGKLKAGLIIVGSHSHHGFERLLGSTANAILHTAICDVLAVRVK